MVRFDPITTDRLDIKNTKTAPHTLHNPVADEMFTAIRGQASHHL